MLKYLSVTPETAATLERVPAQRNKLLWVGAFLLLLAILSNALFVVRVPGQHLWPWVNLILFAVPVPIFIKGLRRAIAQPQVYRGKGAGWFFTTLSAFLLAFAIFGLYASRNIPDASGAPRVGQKAPEFVLSDSSQQPVSLQDLLSNPIENGAPPRAVLLVFYRGYW